MQDWKPTKNVGDQYYVQTLNPKYIPIQPIPITQPQLQHKASFSRKALKLRTQIDKEKEDIQINRQIDLQIDSQTEILE